MILSEYVEGDSLNEAVEIYNGTGTAVALTGYVLEAHVNGNTGAGTMVHLAGTVADGDGLVVADDVALVEWARLSATIASPS